MVADHPQRHTAGLSHQQPVDLQPLRGLELLRSPPPTHKSGSPSAVMCTGCRPHVGGRLCDAFRAPTPDLHISFRINFIGFKFETENVLNQAKIISLLLNLYIKVCFLGASYHELAHGGGVQRRRGELAV